MSTKYEPRRCCICGKEYIPRRIDQKTCGSDECKATNAHRTRHKYVERNYAEVRERNRRYMQNKRDEKRWTPRPDTIVAEGYADRQRAKTLAMVGKIKVEL
jgi:hypothetical protein